VFAAIEKHRIAMKELDKALEEVPGTFNPDPKKEKKFANRELDARDELVSTVPTTLHGLLAVVTYVVGVTNGPLSPSGKADNTFEEPESLCAVLAGAEKILAEQIGRTT
jgi:hypothetical protein